MYVINLVKILYIKKLVSHSAKKYILIHGYLTRIIIEKKNTKDVDVPIYVVG